MGGVKWVGKLTVRSFPRGKHTPIYCFTLPGGPSTALFVKWVLKGDMRVKKSFGG